MKIELIINIIDTMILEPEDWLEIRTGSSLAENRELLAVLGLE